MAVLALRIAALAAVAMSVATAEAQTNEATLSVPGSALVFDGLGLQPPDGEGHFAIGVRLPQPLVKASRCETPYLIVGMGTLNKPEDQLTAADRKIIADHRGTYDRLVADSRHDTVVSIPVRNRAAYLAVTSSGISAPYCTLSIDESRMP
jgi:hypothetical protein